MKKGWKQACAAIILAITFADLKAQDINYEIRGKIGEYSSPAKAYLMYVKGTQQHVDSAIITNGAFSFSGSTDCPKSSTLFINTNGTGFMGYNAGFINFYLEPGKISVGESDSLQKAKILGGQLNKDYAEMNQALKETYDKLDKVNDLFFTASPEKQKSTTFRDSIIKESFKVEEEKKLAALDFLKKHSTTLVSLTALAEYGGLHPDARLLELAFNLLSIDVRSSKAGIKYAGEIAQMKRTAIGAIAPDFTLTDNLGKAVSLRNFRGKYVLIDFWASWCVPCRAENPNIIHAYNLFRKKNLLYWVSHRTLTKQKEPG